MNNYSTTGGYGDTGEWVLSTARRNPEALLLVGAGVCLLMRGASSWGKGRGRSIAPPYGGERDSYQAGSSYQTRPESGSQSAPRELMSQAGEVVSRATDTAAEYASNMKQRVTEAASAYADTASRYGRQAQSTVQETMGRIVREQPLAVAAVGLAAGAAIAAIFPSTRLETRSFGGAREALTQAASKVGENLVGAATQAGQRLASGVAQHGLSQDGLKDLAGEAAETFANAMKGGDTARTSPSIAPHQPSAGAGSGSTPGRAGIANVGSAAGTRNRP